MLTTYWYSLREGFSRRVVLVLFGLAFLIAIGFNLIVGVSPSAPVVVGTQARGPPVMPCPLSSVVKWPRQEPVAFIGLFAAVPLLTVTLDKGWLELTFSKAQPRWKISHGTLSWRSNFLLDDIRLCHLSTCPATVAEDALKHGKWS